VGRDIGAPAGRSAYREAEEVNAILERARVVLARLLGSSRERVAFTLNATDALNIAIKGILRPRDHVVTTVLEHNSVTRPLRTLELERAVQVSRVQAAGDGTVDPDDVRRAIRPNTRLIAILHASNVCGVRLPVRSLGEIAREREIPFLVDAAQTAGSHPIDMREDHIDILAVPGHKGLLGPPGTGALLLGEGVELEGLRQGGTGTQSERAEHPRDYPHRLEAGSPNAPGVAGLCAGVEHILQRGVDSLQAHLESLGRELQEGLDRIGGLTWYGPRSPAEREPIYSVNLAGYKPVELAAALEAGFRVQARAGLHCAPGAHRALGTFPGGTCRLSLGATSTREDVETALAALEELAK
jgi:cysteine desulfurase family protein